MLGNIGPPTICACLPCMKCILHFVSFFALNIPFRWFHVSLHFRNGLAFSARSVIAHAAVLCLRVLQQSLTSRCAHFCSFFLQRALLFILYCNKYISLLCRLTVRPFSQNAFLSRTILLLMAVFLRFYSR